MRNNTVALSTILFVIVCAAGTTYGIPATINFENFGNEGDLVSSINVPGGLTVDFSTESPAGDASLPLIGEFGVPRVGFQTGPVDETARNADRSIYTDGGRFFLTDGLRRTYDYIMDFSIPVENLSLDLYDYRGDGPHVSANLGVDSVELQVFDMAGTQIGSDSYTLPTTRPIDGNVLNLGVSVAGIKSARLHFNGIEGGTGIDNLVFEFVPEPSGLGLLSLGLIGLLGLGRRERRNAA